MRTLTRRGWVRFAALFLLVWISVDLGLPELCAGDVFDRGCATPCLSHSHGSAPTHSGLLHPDHCFCHAHSITLSARAPIVQPSLSSPVDPLCVPAVPAVSLAQLYHPPQPTC